MRLAAAALCAALLAGCYRGPGTASPDETGSYPPGVAQVSPLPVPSGLWSIDTDGHFNCCWMAQEASFAVAVPAGGTRAHVTVYLPDVGPYDARPETLTLGADGAPAKTFARLRAGIYAFDVPVAARSAPYTAVLHVKASYAWTPLALHVSGDSRPLSVQLKSVRVL